jgi:DNA polymerase III delta prime subunit
MIIKYPKINSDYLFSKIENICINEKINYTVESINTLLFVSDKDIRQSINNLECIYYALGSLTVDNIYRLIDKPRLHYINIILNHCLKNNYNDAIASIIDLYDKGYTPNDILLTFMKFLFEDSEHYIELDEPVRLKIYDILSTSYIRINAGVDTILQLCGCISKIFLYLHPI